MIVNFCFHVPLVFVLFLLKFSTINDNPWWQDTQYAFYRTSDGQIGSTVQLAPSQATVWSDLGSQATTQWSQTSSQFEELIKQNEWSKRKFISCYFESQIKKGSGACVQFKLLSSRASFCLKIISEFNLVFDWKVKFLLIQPQLSALAAQVPSC